MTFDVAYRYQQALDPSSLDTIAACVHAIQAAAKDCANAGAPIESDPAVVLLAQHLGSVAVRAYPAADSLKQLCIQAIADIHAAPSLVTLVHQGVAHDADAARDSAAADTIEAKRALARLADVLGLRSADYDLHVSAGAPSDLGEVTLHADRLYVQVTIGGFGPGEILFRSVRGRRDYTGGRNRWARIEELHEPERLGRRIAREVGLELPGREQLPMVA